MTKPTPPMVPPPDGKTASEAALAQLLAFNGIDATTGEYLLPAMGVHELARVATGGRLDADEASDLRNKRLRARQANFGVVEGVDPNDLAQAGWAAVFPSVADEEDVARQAAIRDALAPLFAHRRAQATVREDLYREYAGEHAYRAGESKQQYLARLGAGPGPARPQKVPYYLLLVATPEEIPYRIQYQLDVHYAVGRIAFDTIEEYARYAQSVVDAETGRAARPRRAAFFGVANPDDPATQLSAEHLVAPLADHVASRHGPQGWTVDRYLAEAATRSRLVELLRDPPALLFTASHGMGFPSGDPGQRERQGALLCQDWGGPGKPLAREHYLAGEDLPAGADLRGMIAMLFACYGGGTPTRDEFTRRALGEAKAKQLAPAPLIARLPQRMLAHPAGGALAAVAHIDRAWGASFLWIDAKGKVQTMKHLDVFESMLDSVLVGKRLGYAMEAFNLRYAELAADLSERIEQIQLYDEHYEDSELAHMWIYNSDARNHAVLGDPAVRFPNIGAPARPAADRDAIAVRSEPTAPGTPAAAPASPPAAPSAPQPLPYGWFDKDKDKAQDTAQDNAQGDAAQEDQDMAGVDQKDKQLGFLARLGDKLGDVLSNVIDDVAVLEVKTFTSQDLGAVASGQPLPAGGAQLRAYTRCELDGDTEVCVPMTADGAVDEKLWALHSEMVKQAQAHREELLKIVLSLFRPSLVK